MFVKRSGKCREIEVEARTFPGGWLAHTGGVLLCIFIEAMAIFYPLGFQNVVVTCCCWLWAGARGQVRWHFGTSIKVTCIRVFRSAFEAKYTTASSKGTAAGWSCNIRLVLPLQGFTYPARLLLWQVAWETCVSCRVRDR